MSILDTIYTNKWREYIKLENVRYNTQMLIIKLILSISKPKLILRRFINIEQFLKAKEIYSRCNISDYFYKFTLKKKYRNCVL